MSKLDSIREMWRDPYGYQDVSLAEDYIDELEKALDRVLVIATKWCNKNHHDWEELKDY